MQDETEISPAMTKCSRCKVARYCTPECQAADWQSHKRQCRHCKYEFLSDLRRHNRQVFYGYLSEESWHEWVELIRNIDNDIPQQDRPLWVMHGNTKGLSKGKVTAMFSAMQQKGGKGKGKDNKGKGRGMSSSSSSSAA